MTDNRDFLATEPIGPLLRRLAIPSVAAQMVNLLYNVVDSIYIGHIPVVGRLALTGVGVCAPIVMAVSAFSAFVARGGAPKMSIALGQGNNELAKKILGSCFTLLLIMGAVLTAIIYPLAESFLWMFGASAETIGYAMDYISIYALGTVFVMISMGLNAFITAQGYSKMGMYTVIIGAVLNIILDPVFIFLLDMGVAGAALATVISQGVSAAWAAHFLIKKATIRIERSHLRPDWKILGSCMSLGVSPFIMQITESLISACFNSSLYRYGGDLAVGAMTVFTKLMQFGVMPLQGIAQGAQPITSYNFGRGNAGRVKESFMALLKCTMVYSFTLWALLMAFPQLFMGVFNDSPELIAYGVKPMRIYFAVLCIFGAQMACQNTFLAIGNAKVSLFIALLRKVILLVPLIYILPNFFADKAMAVFLAEPVSDTLSVITTVVLFTINFKRALKNMEKTAH